MKKIIVVLLITLMIIGGFYYLGHYHKDEIYVFYRENVLKAKENITIQKNEYYKKMISEIEDRHIDINTKIPKKLKNAV